jgi:hypothetical protein
VSRKLTAPKEQVTQWLPHLREQKEQNQLAILPELV